MTHCEHYAEAIQEMVDGTLGRLRRSELQIHLDQCDGCRAFLADLERIRDLAGSLDRPAPPDGVWLQIAGRLRQEGRVSTRRRPPSSPRAPITRTRFWRLPRHSCSPSAPPCSSCSRPCADRASLRSAQRPAQPSQGNAAAAQAVQGDIAAGVPARRAALPGCHRQAGRSGEDRPDLHRPADGGDAAEEPAGHRPGDRREPRGVPGEPSSTPARDSLFEALKRKVSLLQDTIALMNQMRKGDAAGAAELVDDSHKG